MISRMTFCSAQASTHPLLALGTNPVKFCEALRRLLNDIKDCFPKSLYQFLGKVWPNPFHHPGAQILFDALQRTGGDNAEVLRLELEAMGAIGDPPALALNIFAWRDGGSSPYYSDEFTLPTHLHPEHAETSVLTMEGDALDRTGQMLWSMGTGWRRCRFHGLLMRECEGKSHATMLTQ